MLDSTKTTTTRSTNRFVLFIRNQLPTLLTLLVLAGIGYWGYRNEWKLPGTSRSAESSTADNGAAEDAKPGPKVVPPEMPDKDCPLDRSRIEFPSGAAVREAGIEIATVNERPMRDTLSAPAEVDYDPTRVARLSSAVPGRIWRVEVEVGQRVRKGDMLALVESAEVGKSKADYLQALTQVDLKSKTAQNLRAAAGTVPSRQIAEVEADLRDARIRRFNAEQALINLGLPINGKELEQLPENELAARMRFLGLPESIFKGLDPEAATSNLLPIKAPLDGMVAERLVSAGELVDSTKNLFVIADLSRIWIVASVRQEDVDRLAMGQPVTFQADGHPGDKALSGDISWISTEVDEKTRSMRARAVVDNPKEHLRAHTFGAALITVRDAPKAITVRSDAVQQEGSCRLVFVQVSDSVFQVRKIRLGVTNGAFTEVQEGLRQGEAVATTGSFVLKSELHKGQLEAD